MRFILPITLLLTAATPALAHRLIVDAKIDGDRLRVEAYYEDDLPAQNALVEVLAGDEKAAEGRTDEKGVWTSALPAPGTYAVRVRDSGHAGRASLVVPDPAATPAAVADEPESREEKTRTPWGRIVFGLALIAGLTLLWRLRPRQPGNTQ